MKNQKQRFGRQSLAVLAAAPPLSIRPFEKKAPPHATGQIQERQSDLEPRALHLRNCIVVSVFVNFPTRKDSMIIRVC